MVWNLNCKISKDSRYIVTGGGGLPLASKGEILQEYIWEDWRIIEENEPDKNPDVESNNISVSSPPQNSYNPHKITPIQGWVVNKQDQIILTANPIIVTPHATTTKTPGCN